MNKGEHNLHLAPDFTSQQMGRVFLLCMCLVAIIIAVKVSVQGLIKFLNQNAKPPLSTMGELTELSPAIFL